MHRIKTKNETKCCSSEHMCWKKCIHSREVIQQGVVVYIIVPATQEVEIGGSWSEACPGKANTRLYLENKQKSKRAGGWLMW
jgi:hypothetical protein